jgi:transcriptional regulator with XRE-family HTH domain
MSELKNQFGKRLRKLRRIKDLTQEELAEQVGVSTNFISQVERGVNAPSFDILQKLAEVLGVRVQEFFDFPEGQ